MLLAILYDASVLVSRPLIASMQSPALDLYDRDTGTMFNLQMPDAVAYHAGAAVSNGTNQLLYVAHTYTPSQVLTSDQHLCGRQRSIKWRVRRLIVLTR